MPKQYGIWFVKTRLREQGFMLISSEKKYVGADKVEYICKKCGKRKTALLNSILAGLKCPHKRKLRSKGYNEQTMNIVSFSGGKDSTAMLLMMLEKGIQVDDIVFCDTGMEFPEMYNHIGNVEKHIKRKVTVLKRKETYQYFLGEHKKRNGKIGYGHPDFRNRWCTQLLKKTPFSQKTMFPTR